MSTWTPPSRAGWWDGLDHPRKDVAPQVYIECGGNTFRRTRGGKKAMAGFWSRLPAVIGIDFKLNSTVQNADYFLPAAQHYEKVAFSIPGPFVANLTLGDKVVEPAGEARSEWDIFLALLTAVSDRAKERGLEAFSLPDGSTQRYDRLVAWLYHGRLLQGRRNASQTSRSAIPLLPARCRKGRLWRSCGRPASCGSPAWG